LSQLGLGRLLVVELSLEVVDGGQSILASLLGVVLGGFLSFKSAAELVEFLLKASSAAFGLTLLLSKSLRLSLSVLELLLALLLSFLCLLDSSLELIDLGLESSEVTFDLLAISLSVVLLVLFIRNAILELSDGLLKSLSGFLRLGSSVSLRITTLLGIGEFGLETLLLGLDFGLLVLLLFELVSDVVELSLEILSGSLGLLLGSSLIL